MLRVFNRKTKKCRMSVLGRQENLPRKQLTSPNLSMFCILDKFPPIDISSKLERILLILPSLDGLFFSLDRKMSPWTHSDACFLEKGKIIMIIFKINDYHLFRNMTSHRQKDIADRYLQSD